MWNHPWSPMVTRSHECKCCHVFVVLFIFYDTVVHVREGRSERPSRSSILLVACTHSAAATSLPRRCVFGISSVSGIVEIMVRTASLGHIDGMLETCAFITTLDDTARSNDYIECRIENTFLARYARVICTEEINVTTCAAWSIFLVVHFTTGPCDFFLGFHRHVRLASMTLTAHAFT